MKPPYCWLCGRDFRCEWFHTRGGGELVRFADYEPLPAEAVGQPYGLEWFCRDHAEQARGLAHLASADALSVLRERLRLSPPVVEPSLMPDPSLWVIKVGPNRVRVFAVIRQASGLSAGEALELLRSAPFELARGWPQSFTSMPKPSERLPTVRLPQ